MNVISVDSAIHSVCKTCIKCQLPKSILDFTILRTTYDNNHNQLKQWRRRDCADCHAKKARDRRAQCRLDVLFHYSNGLMNCECCHENIIEFLSIDHIDGGGRKHRQTIGNSSNDFAAWLRKQGYPPGYRVLCHNCNLSLGHYGYCPHQVDNGKFANLPNPTYPSSELYCPYGHPRFGQDLYITGEKHKRRECLQCEKARYARRKIKT